MIMKQALIVIFICACINSFSNDTITYSNNASIAFSNSQFQDGAVRLNDILNLELGYNRNISDVLSFGGFVGLGIFDEWYKEEDINSLSFTFTQYRYSAHYGLNSKLHILPIQFGFIPSRFDLYLSGNLGFISLFSSPEKNISPERGTFFNYSLMGGGSVYFSKKMGIFVEAGYGKFRYHKGFSGKYGLIVRF